MEDCADKIEVYLDPLLLAGFNPPEIETCFGLDASNALACTGGGNSTHWAYGTYNIEYENGAEKLVNGFVTYTMDYSVYDDVRNSIEQFWNEFLA